MTWPNYEAPDVKYDLIFIDGRLRADCAAVARHCLAEGGVILLHDAHRENYRRVFERFGGGEVVLNTGVFGARTNGKRLSI